MLLVHHTLTIWQCIDKIDGRYDSAFGKMRGRNDKAYMHVWYRRSLDKVCGLHGSTFAMDEMSVLLTKCIGKTTVLLTKCISKTTVILTKCVKDAACAIEKW